MTPTIIQQKTIDHLKDYFQHDWILLNVNGKDDELDEIIVRRCILTDQLGSIIEIFDDGQWTYLVASNPIPEDAPCPMFPDTPRNGVIGYMCKIGFECELGGASGGNTIYPSAESALCYAGCGVVEVEVIGRKIIIDGEGDELVTYNRADATTILKQYDERK